MRCGLSQGSAGADGDFKDAMPAGADYLRANALAADGERLGIGGCLYRF